MNTRRDPHLSESLHRLLDTLPEKELPERYRLGLRMLRKDNPQLWSGYWLWVTGMLLMVVPPIASMTSIAPIPHVHPMLALRPLRSLRSVNAHKAEPEGRKLAGRRLDTIQLIHTASSGNAICNSAGSSYKCGGFQSWAVGSAARTADCCGRP